MTSAPAQHPSPPPSLIGTTLSTAPTPSAILDLAVLRHNCTAMLATTDKLKISFRAHVKTHKTTELARMQVGAQTRDIRLVGSTLAELEFLAPWLREARDAGKTVNIIHGLPLTPSTIPRLATLARALGPRSIAIFADHPSHLSLLASVPAASWPGRIPVWVNVDVGDAREGVAGAASPQLAAVAAALVATRARTSLAGVYTHLGSSYAAREPAEALHGLARELRGARDGAEALRRAMRASGASVAADADPDDRLCLSVGASPTATAAQSLLDASADAPAAAQAADVRALLSQLRAEYAVELHAGVYPVLDLQQLATRGPPAQSAQARRDAHAQLGLRVLAEVASVYADRDAPEALIAAGTVALGREPCQGYEGWGVVAPWPGRDSGADAGASAYYDAHGSRTGWIVSRVSQEHGVLAWRGAGPARELRPGERVLVWPNHACIAGTGFGWYLVVDSEEEDGGVRVRDVWGRCGGW